MISVKLLFLFIFSSKFAAFKTTEEPPCGTLVAYDPETSPKDPEIYGFFSGFYYDGSYLFPGTMNSNCTLQNPTAARITTTTKNQGPGGYTTCGILPIERYDNKTVKYFKAHKNLKWISNNAYEDFADYVPVTSVITMYVGRVNLNLGNGTYQEIGKVWQGELSYYDASSGTFQNTKFFDYLACTAEKTTTLNANLYSLNFGLESSCVSENITSLNPKKPTYSCGTLWCFNNSLNEIKTLGFPSGPYYDGSTIYPGTGNFTTCLGQNPGVARIQTSMSNLGPGAYLSCNGEQFDKTQAKFFLNHPDLRWISTTAKEALNVPGVITVNNSRGSYLVGRIDVFSTNNTWFKQIGKFSLKTMGFMYTGSDLGSVMFTTASFEVLACQSDAEFPISTTTEHTTTSKEEPPCGTLVSYDPITSVKDPEIHGFLSGTFYDGSNVYPGTIQNDCTSDLQCPARISTSFTKQGPGGYTACNDPYPYELHNLKNVKYFLAHKNLKWIATYQVTHSDVEGIIPIIMGTNTMYLGRKHLNIGNGTYQEIGKVFRGMFYWYDIVSNSMKSSTSYEILACVNE